MYGNRLAHAEDVIASPSSSAEVVSDLGETVHHREEVRASTQVASHSGNVDVSNSGGEGSGRQSEAPAAAESATEPAVVEPAKRRVGRPRKKRTFNFNKNK